MKRPSDVVPHVEVQTPTERRGAAQARYQPQEEEEEEEEEEELHYHCTCSFSHQHVRREKLIRGVGSETAARHGTPRHGDTETRGHGDKKTRDTGRPRHRDISTFMHASASLKLKKAWSPDVEPPETKRNALRPAEEESLKPADCPTPLLLLEEEVY
ncbi:hypothetical protein EYF80_064321 [Liparis tanakae]|uniref:Uncharacterized protein n=1 Tax=Liparis tanakae TaxID=230148 RepID=A0A4Z2E9Q7_9TELE|nr:hypothetical protein EYF80_064321 [Liparis tanakae]